MQPQISQLGFGKNTLFGQKCTLVRRREGVPRTLMKKIYPVWSLRSWSPFVIIFTLESLLPNLGEKIIYDVSDPIQYERIRCARPLCCHHILLSCVLLIRKFTWPLNMMAKLPSPHKIVWPQQWMQILWIHVKFIFLVILSLSYSVSLWITLKSEEKGCIFLHVPLLPS